MTVIQPRQSPANGNGKPPLLALVRKLEAVDRRMANQNPAVEEVMSQIIGSRGALGKIKRAIQIIAPRSVAVLITGPTGTGKDLVANALHLLRDPVGRRFIDVNCAAIHSNLAESTLFGHERGSFTGAIGRQIGKFEEAEGGTLFLDEIADLDIHIQAKILRALEAREIQRVGSNNVVPISVRMIAATSKDVESEVKAGRFRADLFYRLCGYRIEVPSLAERPEDLADLADHFLDGFNHREANGTPVTKTQDAWEALGKLIIPGNIRQLKNIIENAASIALAIGEPINIGIIFEAIANLRIIGIKGSGVASVVSGETGLLPEDLSVWQAEQVERAVAIAVFPIALFRMPVNKAQIIQIIARNENVDAKDVETKIEAIAGKGKTIEYIVTVQRAVISEMLRKAGSVRQLARDWDVSQRSLYRNFRKFGLEIKE